MTAKHEDLYSRYQQQERLKQVDMTPASYNRLKHSAAERSKRESVIMEEEVDAAVKVIIEHPEIGAGKLHYTLLDQEKAIISTSFLNEDRMQIAQDSEAEFRRRREEEKTLEAELNKRLLPLETYQHIEALAPHHIWAIDFVNINFLGFRFCLCVIYDIFSQAYLCIQAGDGCTEDLACRALKQAAVSADCQARFFLRRDNGKAFITESFQELLVALELTDQPIPPGSPWFNGSLESNNGNLKASIKAAGMQGLVNTPLDFQIRGDIGAVLDVLQRTCDTTLQVLNEKISRPKFEMPPQQVMDGKIDETRKRHQRFIEQKTADRSARMADLRQRANRSERNKTFLEKIRRYFKQAAKAMSTDQLYVLNEIIHGRFLAIET